MEEIREIIQELENENKNVRDIETIDQLENEILRLKEQLNQF